MNAPTKIGEPVRALARFQDPDWTAKGERRASVALDRLETLWINTGTLCNITCANCYIESSPSNDLLAYIRRAEVRTFLDEIRRDGLPTREIGFTGGEPFMNPDILGMLEDALAGGHRVLVLTNAMQPMQRPRIRKGLQELQRRFADRLVLRVSLDHYTEALHEAERGAGTWRQAIAGLDWLAAGGFRIAIAGRTCWGEGEEVARQGYARLIAAHDWPIGPSGIELVLLPEMDERAEVPEISTGCWEVLGRTPGEMMCASSRMVVKRKGADRPTVLPCTLIAYQPAFDMGPTLADAARADGGMFADGAVKLCHPHCARFCVLGGGSCSGHR